MTVVRRPGRGGTATLPNPGSALPRTRLAAILDTDRMQELERHLTRAFGLDEERSRAAVERLVRRVLDDVGARYAAEMGAHIDAIVDLRARLGEIVDGATRGRPPVENVDVLLDTLRGHLDGLRDLRRHLEDHPPEIGADLVRDAVDATPELIGPSPPPPLARSRDRGREILAWGRRVLRAAAAGETLEPQGVDPVRLPWPDHPLLQEQLRAMARAMDAYQRADLSDPSAAVAAADALQRAVADGNEVLRSFGRRFEVTPAGDRLPPTRPVPAGTRLAPGSAAEDAARIRSRLTGHRREPGQLSGRALETAPPAALFDALAFDALDVTAAGTLGEPLARRLPGVGQEGYTLTPGDVAAMPTRPRWLAARLAALVDGWQRAHLVGPGFGGEVFAGLMLAPWGVNQVAQNKGAERFLRQAAAATGSSNVAVSVTARGRRLAIPLQNGSFEHIDVLASVRYEIPRPPPDGPLFYEITVRPDGSWDARHNLPPGTPGADTRTRGRR